MSVEQTAQTSVQQVDLDLDGWLGAPSADSIVTPDAGKTAAEPKPNLFSRNTTDMSFLDDDDQDDDDDKGTDGKAADDKTPSAAAVKDLFDDLDNAGTDDDDNDDQVGAKTKGGRPKTEKSSLVGFLKKRIESKEMFAFDDFDEDKQTLDEYLGTLGEKDVEELWQANIDTMKKDVAANTPKEFFEALPTELQQAAKYVLDGGQDLKGLFTALAQVETVRELNPVDENDQESIVRSYLQTTGYGDEEMIEDEIQTWKDLGKLETKAKQFKPKLDKMQEEQVAYQLQQQEERKEQQQAAAEAYMQNVFEALRPGEINGLKLDKKTQATLYQGLVNPEYPSISGRGTNMLGHLLEKYQYVEPNYPLIAEALWLLSNPEEYRNNLQKQGENRQVEKTARQLKTEQSKKVGSTNTYDDDNSGTPNRKISRNTNIFKR